MTSKTTTHLQLQDIESDLPGDFIFTFPFRRVEIKQQDDVLKVTCPLPADGRYTASIAQDLRRGDGLARIELRFKGKFKAGSDVFIMNSDADALIEVEALAMRLNWHQTQAVR